MMLSKSVVYNQSLNTTAVNIVMANQASLTKEESDAFKSFIALQAELLESKDQALPPFILNAEQRGVLPLLDDGLASQVMLRVNLASYHDSLGSNFKLLAEINHPIEIDSDLSRYHGLIISKEHYLNHKEQVKALAERYEIIVKDVASYEDFNVIKESGISYVLGDFIETPEERNNMPIPPNKLAVLKLITLLNTEDVTVDDLSRVISADSIISYKLLRILNSPMFRRSNAITSVQEAVVRFGLSNLKKWVLMLSLCNLLDKPKDLTRLTVERALMCKYFSEQSNGSLPPDVSYTAGLLSNLDAFLDQPLSLLLSAVHLTDEVNDAIVEKKGPLGELLQTIIDYQHGSIDGSDVLFDVYLKSATEADVILSSIA